MYENAGSGARITSAFWQLLTDAKPYINAIHTILNVGCGC
jgi:hypothetical protein